MASEIEREHNIRKRKRTSNFTDASEEDLLRSPIILKFDERRVESIMSPPPKTIKKLCFREEIGADSNIGPPCTLRRSFNDELDEPDLTDSNEEFVGCLLTARTNRFNVPRCRLRQLHVMIFKDTDQPSPLEFEGGLSWAKMILKSYYLVGTFAYGLTWPSVLLFARCRTQTNDTPLMAPTAVRVFNGMAGKDL